MKVFRGDERETLLHVAASRPTVNLEIVTMLLEHIDIDESGGAIHTALRNTELSEDERLCLVNLFVKAGADLGADNEEGHSAIHSYIMYLINNVLAEDIALQCQDSSYLSRLRGSHINRNCLNNGTWKEIIDILSVAHINEKNRIHGKTPLYDIFEKIQKHCSQIENVTTIMDYLLTKGASLSVVSKSKLSILHIVVETYNIDMVKYAIQNGCPLDKLDNTDFNPLYYLCDLEEYSNEQCENILLPLLEVLINAGAEINTKA